MLPGGDKSVAPSRGGFDNRDMRIVFTRATRGESIATIHRNDGVVVELPSYSRTHRVPHDLAHAVAERQFGLIDGVFGSIAAGAVFENMRVVAGRPRHDAAERSKRILAANKGSLTVAEVMAGVVHHAVERPTGTAVFEEARHDWGSVRPDPFPWAEAEVVAAVETLRELGGQWAALGPDGSLEFSWPDRLIGPVPRPAGKTRHPSPRRSTR
jgi:hypothetical protein